MPIFSEQHSPNADNSNVSYASSAAPSTTPSANPSANPSPPYSVPLTISLLISESLFTDLNSPAATLIIPFVRREIPYAYFLISILEFTAALLTKWSYGPSYSLLSPASNTSFPDVGYLRTTNTQGDSGSATGDTPIFPKGITFNISFSSPFSAPVSKTSTLFTFELKEIKNVPGYIVPLAGLVLYFVLIPFYRRNKNAAGSNKDNVSKQ